MKFLEIIFIYSPENRANDRASLKAGALGAKINGSGGGGCIFAYSPGNAQKVAEALDNKGAKTHIVHIDEGVRRE